jgi:HEAT repeat protein
VRESVAKTLIRSGNETSSPFLERLIEEASQSGEVRNFAMIGLGEIRDKNVVFEKDLKIHAGRSRES